MIWFKMAHEMLLSQTWSSELIVEESEKVCTWKVGDNKMCNRSKLMG